MIKFFIIALMALMPNISNAEENMAQIYQYEIEKADGGKTTLAEYQGKVMLIVNVASRCGFTSQYDGLQQLFENYRDQGFIILGFPANNFMNQEPGSNEEIQDFCRLNYGVSFPVFAKISVKGNDIHPLYAYLTDKTQHQFGGSISWNFNKFLIDRQGNIIGRFSSPTKPESSKVIKAIETALEIK